MRGLVTRLRRQPDDELRFVALLVEEPVEDERAHEAPRLVRPDPQAAIYSETQQSRGVARRSCHRSAKLARKTRQRLARHTDPDDDEPTPNAQGKTCLAGHGEARGTVVRDCRQ